MSRGEEWRAAGSPVDEDDRTEPLGYRVAGRKAGSINDSDSCHQPCAKVTVMEL